MPSMAAERFHGRVLMTADTLGGVWPFAIELARQLAGRGDRVLLAAMGREPDASQRAEAAAIPGLELHARPYRLVWMQDPWRDLDAAADWLQALARDFAPDVIHLNDLALAERGWPAPVLLTAHSCVCSWWQAVHGTAAPREWDAYRDRVAACVHSADHVVAPSQAMLQALAGHYGAPVSCEVIHNGRTAPPQASYAKARFVLGAGRLWDQAKNLGALAAVAGDLPWPVLLAGDARHPHGGDAAFEGGQVLGRLPEAQLRAWMAKAPVYALPARYEPFGLSALEAAQGGCALVLGDIPSLREIWADAALFVPPDDPDALRDALRRLIDDDVLRARMARQASARARRYTPEAMAARYRRAYAALRCGHARPARATAIPDVAGAHA